MKRILFFFSFLALLSIDLVGQEQPPAPPKAPKAAAPPEPPTPPTPTPPEVRLERFESMKVAHITSKLELTPEEAQVFWPVYNKWDDEKKALRKEYRPEKKMEEMSEEEAEAYLEKVTENRKQMAELEDGMLEDIRKVLPADKVVKLLQAEKSFHHAMVKKMRDKYGHRDRERTRGQRVSPEK